MTGLRSLKRIVELEDRLAGATDVINRGVALMTPEQLGQWAGVRAWLEQSGSNRVKELEAERDAALACVRQLEKTVKLIKAEPHGCPMCDSGKLRNLTKLHWDECGFSRIDGSLAVAARVLGETK